MVERSNRILVVDNDRSIRWVIEKALTDEGYDVDVAVDGRSALDMIEQKRYALVVMDVKMPVMDGITALRHIREIPDPPETIIITAHSSMENIVEAMKLGAFDHIVKPFDIDDIIRLAERAIAKYHDRGEIPGVSEIQISDRIIGDSPVMRELYKLLGRVASTTTSVLLTGETGTGKDLFARAIHHHSERRNGPFISVNCASIPGELLESELFGHEKGAFTGATSLRIGKCELAQGGTLFLDEIGAMRLDLQAKLLTFLQRNEFERVGSSRTIKVDARVIAATNADLKDLTTRGLFREDLYYRLMVVPIVIPPLRERIEDISSLARYFVDRFNIRYGLHFRLTPELLHAFEEKEWLGNVRELENRIHRMVVLQSDSVVQDETISLDVPKINGMDTVDQIAEGLVESDTYNILETAYAKIEKPLISKLMLKVNGNQSDAAKKLGISRNTLRKLLIKHGLFS
jgi:two-component system, NtrC family, nitrogen regulation response regulator GlnG